MVVCDKYSILNTLVYSLTAGLAQTSAIVLTTGLTSCEGVLESNHIIYVIDIDHKLPSKVVSPSIAARLRLPSSDVV